jgi:hypothetical protein
MSKSCETLKVKGFTRIRIGHEVDGKLVIDGDTGWCGPNQVVNLGFQDYICAAIGAVAGSKQISHMGIGTGTAPGASDTSLQGETGTRKTTSNSVVASKTMQATAAWASGDHPGGTPNIRNLGLFNTSSGGTVCCGNTFSSSAWNSNQGVSATYQLQFS